MVVPVEKWSLLALARFALAFMVAVSHLAGYGLADLHLLSWAPALGPIERVMCFLLISGYSIGASFGREPEGFLKRRAWRIYPMYGGAIALTCIAIPQSFDLPTLLQNLFFLNQITTSTSLVEPSWSLALEIWLYFLTPWLWRLPVERLRALIYASFCAYCCYELGRTVFHLPYYAGLGYGVNLVVLSFPWLAGFLMAREPAVAARTLRDLTLIFAGHILVALSVQALYRWKHAELTQLLESDLMGFAARSVTLIVILLLFKAIVEGKTGTVKSRMMRRLGDAAYPLYLVHLAVFIILSRFAIRDAGIHLSAAVLAAFAFYWLFHPFGQRRSRARKASDSAPAASEREPAGELEKEQVGELSTGSSHLKT